MKKILTLIITILGVGVSFCSATDYEITFLGGTFDFVNGYNGNLYNNFTFNSSLSEDLNARIYGRNPIDLQLSGFDGQDVILDTICFGTYGGYFDCNGSNRFDSTNIFYSSCNVNSSNNLGTCFSGLNINLKNSSYSLTGLGVYLLSSEFINYSFLVLSDYLDYTWPGSPLIFKGLFGGNEEIIFPYGNCRGDSFCIPTYIKFSIPSGPKLKINYGNTSYEYELEDNLSIYLKSPITQSGYTFTYAGSTGINLYFNNTSQFYNKDKMYLKTPSWYNNFVFTPVCL